MSFLTRLIFIASVYIYILWCMSFWKRLIFIASVYIFMCRYYIYNLFTFLAVRGSQVHAESGVACTRGACIGRVVCTRGDLISWQAQHFGTSLVGSYVHALMRCVAGAACKLIWFGRWFSFSFGANLIMMCTVQCGSMEAKALSFVLHTAGSEHHQ